MAVKIKLIVKLLHNVCLTSSAIIDNEFISQHANPGIVTL